jgi:protocatechuate 3,4-dioxygenase alpha subunit
MSDARKQSQNEKPATLPATTSQTVGPYFKIGLEWLNRDLLAAGETLGGRVTIQGKVLDGDGNPVSDAVLEIWQANSYGKYAHPEDTQEKALDSSFTGFGRVPTDHAGVFRFTTIKPGTVPGPDGHDQAAHLSVSIFMRGLLRRLTTRIYFPDDPRNTSDPILNLVEPARRQTLIAKASMSDPGLLEWNVVLQGALETVFFDLGL